MENRQPTLVPKARDALLRYGHQVVLARPKFEVVFVSRTHNGIWGIGGRKRQAQ
ncbi:hypothetical protein AX14_010881, partial [Amanita brunnescens Koide BX004]